MMKISRALRKRPQENAAGNLMIETSEALILTTTTRAFIDRDVFGWRLSRNGVFVSAGCLGCRFSLLFSSVFANGGNKA
jgi:hypothetical protein